MRLSRRYALHLAAALALACAPVLVHSYAGLQRDECTHPTVLVPRAKTGEAKRKRDAWMRERLHAHQWREGRIRSGESGEELRYAIVRSYDPKRLYYRPEASLVDGPRPRGRELEWIEEGDVRLPVQRLRYPSSRVRRSTTVAAYLLVYGGKPVVSPYWAQLRAAPKQMLTGSQPMTLLFAATEARPDDVSSAEERTRAWLAGAWREYRSACGG